MSDPNLDYTTIRRNIDKKLARRKWNYRIGFFVAHLLFFIVSFLLVLRTIQTNPQLREILFYNNSGLSIIVIAPAIMWGMVLLVHVASLYFESSAGEKAIRKQLLMHEVGDDLLKMGNLDDATLEKPKRRAASNAKHLRLSDDGELIPADDDQALAQPDYTARTNHVGSA